MIAGTHRLLSGFHTYAMTTPAVRSALRGRSLLNEPSLNKGTAFTVDERRTLGIDGLLPSRVETITEQTVRDRDKYDRLHDSMERHIFLRALHDANTVLFYALVEDNLAEMLPVLYTPTVGLACQEFSHIYRRPHGLFLSYPDRHRIAEQLDEVEGDIAVVVVTDGERILGLGDLGVGGMGIPIGKLSLYTAAGGIDPQRCLPVFLDVGTNNEELLADPLYLGWRHERVTEDQYNQFIAAFVGALSDRFPGVLLQWEDFAAHHANRLLHQYRDRILSFNDDIQGTAAVALAAIHAAAVAKGSTLRDECICIAGAGSAGSGIATMLRDAIASEGSPDPTANLYLTDTKGLVHDGRDDLVDYKLPFAQRWEHVSDWADPDGPTSLAAVMEHARPSILIGVSGQPAIFTESMVRSMAAAHERPIILPLSNPTDHTEATPHDLLDWTDGRALIATGSPFADVVHDGVVHRISQANNVYVFPGLGLGTIAVKATSVTDAMLLAAARAVADDNSDSEPGSTVGILPPLESIHAVSRRIARAVGRAAVAEGVAEPMDEAEIDRRVESHWWHPEYAPIDQLDGPASP